jgi:hypothetical protein
MNEHPSHAPEPDAPIAWHETEAAALAQVTASRRPLMIYFSGSPACRDSLALEAVGFPDQRVAAFIKERVVPLHVDVRRSSPLVRRFAVVQTPQVLVIDAQGYIHARIEGFMPPDELRARLALAVADCECAAPHPLPDPPAPAAQPARADAEFTAETLYWHAASRFRRTGDRHRLRADWQMIASRFPRSVWALRMRLVDGETTRQAG